MRPTSVLLRAFFSSSTTLSAASTPSIGSIFGAVHTPFVEEVARRLNSAEFVSGRRTLPSNGKNAAVLVPILMRGNEPHLLFTLRTSHLTTHAGQVSFAGGHIDPGETAVQAALREFSEELGVELPFSLLGTTHDAIAITGTHVTPVIAACLQPLEDLNALKPNPDEVAEVFTLPLAHLADPMNHEYEYLSKKAKGIPPSTKSSSAATTTAGGKKMISVHGTTAATTEGTAAAKQQSPAHPRAGLWLPVFHGGPARIWGLTGFLTMEVLKDVFVPAARAIKYDLKEPRSPPNGRPADIPNLPPSKTEQATADMGGGGGGDV
jgi:8-oxo-dGTP pyrophosphatase MutT (NUDIX family)